MATCAHVSDTLREGGVYAGLGLRGHSGLDQEPAAKMKTSPKKMPAGKHFIISQYIDEANMPFPKRCGSPIIKHQ